MNKGVHKRNDETWNRWGCKRERERELQFSKIDIEENKGEKAFICDREKDRNKANDSWISILEIPGWQEQRTCKSLFVQIA